MWRTVWRYLRYWPTSWLGVPVGMALSFATGMLIGVVVLDRAASDAVPLSVALAVGSGLAQAYGVLWPKQPRRPAWPQNPPPPGRPD
jgi:hypothetical protein